MTVAVSTRANNELTSVVKALPQNATVFDYGCHGWRVHALAQQLGRADLQHAGCDIVQPAQMPAGALFKSMDLNSHNLAVQDDAYDLIVASHVIEHHADPCSLFAELARICRPGGKIYIEAPSDRAVRCASDPRVEFHAFLSFWDDPTHLRPWTPAAYYRLALSFGMTPLCCAYVGTWVDVVLYPWRRLCAIIAKNGDAVTQAKWLARKWLCVGVFEKPRTLRGKPAFRYVTLRGVAKGYGAALAAVADNRPEGHNASSN